MGMVDNPNFVENPSLAYDQCIVNVVKEVGMGPVRIKQIMETMLRLALSAEPTVSHESVARELGMSPVRVKQVGESFVCHIGPAPDAEALVGIRARLAPTCS